MKCCGFIFKPSLAEATLCELIIIQLTDGLIIVLLFWTKLLQASACWCASWFMIVEEHL